MTRPPIMFGVNNAVLKKFCPRKPEVTRYPRPKPSTLTRMTQASTYCTVSHKAFQNFTSLNAVI